MNKRINTKGQVSVEYLTAYGWIILVAILAIAAVVYLGMTNPNNYSPEECRIQGELECIDKYLSIDGNITFLIKNNYPVDLVLWDATTSDGKALICSQTELPRGESRIFQCQLGEEFIKDQKYPLSLNIKFQRNVSDAENYTASARVNIKANDVITILLGCQDRGGVEVCDFPVEYCHYTAVLGDDGQNQYTLPPSIPNGETDNGHPRYDVCCLEECKSTPTCRNGMDDDNDLCADYEDLDCESDKPNLPEAGLQPCNNCELNGGICRLPASCGGGIFQPNGQDGYCPTEGEICCKT